MDTWVSLDGRIVPGEEATVPVLDRGFLFGDSVYEVVRTYAQRPFLFDAHLERLQASASRLGILLPGGVESIARQVHEILDHVQGRLRSNPGGAAEPGDWYIRIIVTRGSSLPSLDPSTAGPQRLVIIVRPLSAPDPEWAGRGTTARIVNTRRSSRVSLDPAIKSGNYLNNIMALMEARAAGAREAIMLNAEGEVTEASTANIFLVHDGQVATPALECGILSGITRGLLLQTARHAGIPLHEKRLYPEDLRGADEIFLTSTLREIQPIIELDGRKVGQGTDGPITRRLSTLLRARIRELAGL
ncbi:MAG: aminotransferase class IV [Planctomycetota bacterium]